MTGGIGTRGRNRGLKGRLEALGSRSIAFVKFGTVRACETRGDTKRAINNGVLCVFSGSVGRVVTTCSVSDRRFRTIGCVCGKVHNRASVTSRISLSGWYICEL